MPLTSCPSSVICQFGKTCDVTKSLLRPSRPIPAKFQAQRAGRREARGLVTRPAAHRSWCFCHLITILRAPRCSKGRKDDKKNKSRGGQATLQQTYTFHTPGSVQEPSQAPAVVTFAHQLPEEAAKWAGTVITHVGDTKTGDGVAKKLGVVIGEFHDQLMNECLEDARLAAQQMGAEIVKVVWVPGSYEALLPVKHMLEDSRIDAVVMLGDTLAARASYVNVHRNGHRRGSTLHGQEMGSTCSHLLKGMELQYNKPIGMGIIGPGATAEQAATRVAYAGSATRAAVRMCHYMDTRARPL
eukprot:838860-Prorocentrum_minimum.AAC.3